jgi:hypothetical protein
MKIKIYSPNIPATIIAQLERATLHYPYPVSIFHAIWLHTDSEGERWCGVFGDDDNGAYGWFILEREKLFYSDAEYGAPAVALREVLNLTVIK